MLQQTQVATVHPLFRNDSSPHFPMFARWRRPASRTSCGVWEGLGYYRRAGSCTEPRSIIATRYGGEFPRDPAVLRSLPGIGRYTAGAVLSIAFGDCQPILEANTLRLLSRLLAYRGDPRSAEGQALLWSFAGALGSATPGGSIQPGADGSRECDLPAAGTGLRRVSRRGTVSDARARLATSGACGGQEAQLRAACAKRH